MRSLLIGFALAAAVIPAASLGSSINSTDRANAKRACTSLRTSLGVKTFTDTFGTFGACVSKETLAAHSARVQATASCRSRPHFQSCVTTRTQANLNAQVSTLKNAARQCAQIRSNFVSQLGATAGAQTFNATFGTNINDKNAFGKCVSAKAKAKSTGQAQTQTTVQSYQATISSVSNSGVAGQARFLLVSTGDLAVALKLHGLAGGSTPTVNIVDSCSNSTNTVLALNVNVAANNGGNLDFIGHYTGQSSSTLTNNAIAVFSGTTLLACGPITS